MSKYRVRLLNSNISNVAGMDGVGIIEFENKIHLVAGWPGVDDNTHYTTIDGITFTQLADTPFSSHCQVLSVLENELTVMGSDTVNTIADRKKVYRYNSTDGWYLKAADWGIPEITLCGFTDHYIGSTKYVYIAGGLINPDVGGLVYNNEVYRSTNGYQWEHVSTLPVGCQNSRTPVMYSKDGVLYYAFGCDSDPGTSVINALYTWVYKSTDNGVTWTLVATHDELASSYPTKITGTGIWDGKMWVQRGGTLVGGVAKNSTGLYYTDDNWVTIKKLSYCTDATHAATLVVYNDELYRICGNLVNKSWKIVKII